MPKPNPHSGSDQRGRVLIVYASPQGHARAIANAIAARIRGHGIVAEIGDATCGVMPPPQDYDAVVLGTPVDFRPGTKRLASYIAEHRKALSEVPAALFTISTSGAPRDQDPGGFLAQFVRATGWQPDFAAAFAGGEPLPREGWLVRLIGHERAAQPIGALPTDWIDVDRFADKVATELARASVSAERTEPHVADASSTAVATAIDMAKRRARDARKRGAATQQTAMPHATDQELSRFESEGGSAEGAPERARKDAEREQGLDRRRSR